MGARKFASNQLLLAEDELHVLTRWADDVGLRLGVIADDIHFDGREPADVSGLIEQIRKMRCTLDRAEGLVLAYEISRLSQQLMREMTNDDTGAC